MAAKKRRKAAKKKAAKRKVTKRKATKRKSTKRKAAKRKTTKRKAAKKRPKKKATRRKAAKKRPKRKAAKRKVAKKKKRVKRKPSAAFMRPVQPDAALAAVVGSTPIPRTQITKKLWTYIKRRGLQDSKNRRMINADDNLRRVFNGRSQVSMFEMTKLVSRHVS
jgi:chromatin remodeling complex protein RSC6